MKTQLELIIERLTAPDGPYPLTEVTVRGVTYKAISNAPDSLRDYYAVSQLFAEKDFIVYDDERYTFAQVKEEMARFAHALKDKLGVKRGTAVAIAMRNYPEWAFAFLAITSIGGIAVPLNAWWTSEELEYAIKDSGAKVVVADDKRLELVKDFAPRLGVKPVAVRCEADLPAGAAHYRDLVAGITATELPEVTIDPDDDATLFYTSGSTGYPKGVIATHRAVCNGMMNWGLAIIARLESQGIDPSDSPFQPATLMTVPLFHVTGSHAIFLLSMLIGRKLVFMYRWDPRTALELIQKERITGLTGVPTMSWEILNVPDVDDYDLTSLTELGAGGAARPPEHVRKLKEKFPNAQPAVGYGLTETNALGAVNFGDDYIQRPGSTGKPTPPLIEMRIVDEADRDVPQGEDGEILIKSVVNARGYWNRPEDTAEAFRDGWFYTGDIGHFDKDGFLYIVDRAKDIVIRGGENISCLEVEAVIYQHPAVLECAVFGLPDERLGEILAAVVVLKDGENVSVEDIQMFVARHLAKFKVPERIWLQYDPLPRTASEKIFKRQLRDERLK